MIEIKNLHVEIENKEIIKEISLKLEKGKINVLMGPNGSGKSTLANVLMGNPKYKIKSGKILLNNEDITNLEADERAKKGLFLSFQYPEEISGVTISNFLRTSFNSLKKEKIPVLDFKKILDKNLEKLDMNLDFSNRYLNQGFSGGEKKRAEILQLLTLDPKIAILDETDSGLDVDSLKTVASGVNEFMNKDKTVIIITHYRRILDYIKPDKTIVMINGKIVKEGSSELASEIDKEGYSKYLREST